MTGPGHYAAAETLIAELAGCRAEEQPCPFCGHAVARAQVHAALALADATALAAVMGPEERDDWDRATGRLGDAGVTP